jgi:uncharacterized protein (DUF1330 family)
MNSMTAYIVGRLKVWDRDWLAEYLPKVTVLIEKHGGRFLVLGGSPEQIEGSEEAANSAIILEFPSRDAAMAFWNAEEFAPLVKLRNTGSSMEAMVLDGVL